MSESEQEVKTPEAQPAPDIFAAAKALMPEMELIVEGVGEYIVKGLSAREVTQCNKLATKVTKKGRRGQPDITDIDGEKLSSTLICRSLHNKDGTRVFTDEQEGKIFELPHLLIRQLQQAVFKVNGMEPPKDDEDEEAGGN